MRETLAWQTVPSGLRLESGLACWHGDRRPRPGVGQTPPPPPTVLAGTESLPELPCEGFSQPSSKRVWRTARGIQMGTGASISREHMTSLSRSCPGAHEAADGQNKTCRSSVLRSSSLQETKRAPGWLGQLGSQLLALAQGPGIEPCLGLRGQQGACLGFSLLCPPPALSLSNNNDNE